MQKNMKIQPRTMRHRERMRQFTSAYKMGLKIIHEEPKCFQAHGSFIIDIRDEYTGEQLAHIEKPNIITLDAGILMARLCKDSRTPTSGQNNGLRMLAIGTGATGATLSPDAPQNTQRKLNNEIARKAFSSAQYRDSDGNAVAYETRILDLTAVFGSGEAVGGLNEMGILAPFSSNPAVTNPIVNGPSDYDDTIDVSSLDLMANYLTFGVIVKPAPSIMTVTWRLTFG